MDVIDVRGAGPPGEGCSQVWAPVPVGGAGAAWEVCSMLTPVMLWWQWCKQGVNWPEFK